MKLAEQIILEDENLVAINKPSGVLTIADREGNTSLKTFLLQAYGAIYTVHRLDKDTSGVVVFARTEAVHKQLSQLFESRTVEKFYLGLVIGKLLQPSGTIDAPIMEHPVKKGTMVINKRGKASVTDYQVQEAYGLYSLVQFQIHTGRTHQIRVHMKHIGHPIVCDEVYGDGKPVFISSFKKNYHLSKGEEEEKPVLSRLALHSWKLNFSLNNKEYRLEAEPPKDIRAVINQLRKNKK